MTSKNGKSKKSSSNSSKEISLLCADELGYLRFASSSNAYGAILHRFDSSYCVSNTYENKKNKETFGIEKLCSSFHRQMGCNLYAVARRNGKVEIFRAGNGGFFQPLYDKTVGGVAAVSVLKCVGLDFTEDGKQLTVAAEDGTVTVLRVKEDGEGTWKSGGADARSFALLKEDVARREEEGVVLCARASKDGKRLLYGGKGQGNDVKIVDVEQEGKLVWKAKPPPVNRLNYRAPPWVKCARFKDRGEANGGNESCVFAVGTGEKKVRLYDTRANKRATMEVEYGEAPVNSVAFSSVDEHRMFAADSRGKCCAIDLRTSKACGAIRGNSGSVREIEAHPTLDLVATVGLDRYVRVYNGSSRKCLGAAYAKQNLTCVAWDAFQDRDGNRKKKKGKRVDADNSDDSDNDDEDDEENDNDILPKKRKKKKSKSSDFDDLDDASLRKAKKKKKKKTNEDVIVNYVDFDSDDE